MELIKTNMQLDDPTDSGGGGSFDKSTTEDRKITEDDPPDYTADQPGHGLPEYDNTGTIDGSLSQSQDGQEQSPESGNSGQTETDPVYNSVKLSASQKTPSGAKETEQQPQKKQSRGILAGITGTKGVLLLLVVIMVVFNWKQNR